MIQQYRSSRRGYRITTPGPTSKVPNDLRIVSAVNGGIGHTHVDNLAAPKPSRLGPERSLLHAE